MQDSSTRWDSKVKQHNLPPPVGCAHAGQSDRWPPYCHHLEEKRKVWWLTSALTFKFFQLQVMVRLMFLLWIAIKNLNSVSVRQSMAAENLTCGHYQFMWLMHTKWVVLCACIFHFSGGILPDFFFLFTGLKKRTAMEEKQIMLIELKLGIMEKTWATRTSSFTNELVVFIENRGDVLPQKSVIRRICKCWTVNIQGSNAYWSKRSELRP